MRSGVTGVVLAGGDSRRFGSNKALAPWEGKTLVESVTERVSGLFAATLVLVKDPSPFKFLERAGVRVVADESEEQHSLGGILSGLTRAETEHVFVCACDMPFLEPRLIEALWAAGRGYDAAIPVWRGTPQPLCGIYSRGCRGVVDCMIGDGRLKILELFTLVRTRFFLEAEVAALDPRGLSFVDLDTRAEYEAARRLDPARALAVDRFDDDGDHGASGESGQQAQ